MERRTQPNDFQITPEMIALFRKACDIEAAGDHERWENEGGRRREWHDTAVALHSALGRTLWQHDVIDVYDGAPPDWAVKNGLECIGDWEEARDIRRRLEELAFSSHRNVLS
jgi:hypothetical protein